MNNKHDDELTYLMKQIVWPQPDRGLAFRIESAVAGSLYSRALVKNGPQEWRVKSPALAFAAVILALFLGIASGAMAGGQASANEINNHPYVTTSTISVMKLYAGQE